MKRALWLLGLVALPACDSGHYPYVDRVALKDVGERGLEVEVELRNCSGALRLDLSQQGTPLLSLPGLSAGFHEMILPEGSLKVDEHVIPLRVKADHFPVRLMLDSRVTCERSGKVALGPSLLADFFPIDRWLTRADASKHEVVIPEASGTVLVCEASQLSRIDSQGNVLARAAGRAPCALSETSSGVIAKGEGALSAFDEQLQLKWRAPLLPAQEVSVQRDLLFRFERGATGYVERIADGRVLWRQKASQLKSAPFATADGRTRWVSDSVQTVDSETGQIESSIPTPISTQVFVFDSRYLSLEDGKLRMRSLQNGSILWEATSPSPSVDAHAIGELVLVSSRERTFMFGSDGAVLALRAELGRVVAATTQGFIFRAGENTTLTTLNLQTVIDLPAPVRTVVADEAGHLLINDVNGVAQLHPSSRYLELLKKK